MHITAENEKTFAIGDSERIQSAVKAAKEAGENTVTIPKKNPETGKDVWNIDKAVLLPDGITVVLDGCRLRLCDGTFDNIFRNEEFYSEEHKTQKGIRILGKNGATLDGGKDNGLREQDKRPDKPPMRTGCLVLLGNVDGYEISGIRCVNMRYWAINQIGCRHGRVADIEFDAGLHHPNQDGINLRVGCSFIEIENISGYTGDDTVALSAFPMGSDAKFLPAGASPDICHVTIRNVRSCTHSMTLALRNTDGARIYDISAEHIAAETKNGIEPWAAVRLGENNWYRKRPAALGEVYGITLRDIRCDAKGAIYLSAALSDSRICDVSAAGTSLYAISTYMAPQKHDETGCDILPGISMKNVTIENVSYTGSARYTDSAERYTELTFPGEHFPGCAVDFRCLRDDDTFEDVTVCGVSAGGKREKLLLPADFSGCKNCVFPE